MSATQADRTLVRADERQMDAIALAHQSAETAGRLLAQRYTRGDALRHVAHAQTQGYAGVIAERANQDRSA